ncbi:homeodomain super [Madurella fahalii]|uniref:Homeodomain super n=1 Tax=Madurella fahalii TaxID=1157608 RepID=A0ABQ0GQW9_9PEZI
MAHSPARVTYNGGDSRQFGDGFTERPAESNTPLPSISELGLNFPIRQRDPSARVPAQRAHPPEVYDPGPPSSPAYSYSSRPSQRRCSSFSETVDELRDQVPRVYSSLQRETSPGPRPARSIHNFTQPDHFAQPPPDSTLMGEPLHAEFSNGFTPAYHHQRPSSADYGRDPATMPRAPASWSDGCHSESGYYFAGQPNAGAAHGGPSQHPPSHYRGYPPPHPPSHRSHHHLSFHPPPPPPPPPPPVRSHSFSLGSVQHPEHRIPFSGGGGGSGGGYSSGYPGYMRESGGLEMRAGEARPRRRRGNLPKETTDILRAWFDAHIDHPYPSEETKQQMVRQTRLQINQISNWFINARRRYLPTVKSQRTASAGAPRSRAAADGRLPPIALPPEYDAEQRRHRSYSGSGESAYAEGPLTGSSSATLADPRAPVAASNSLLLPRAKGFGPQSV